MKLVSCHAITVELIAKQMRASFIPPAKMLDLLREGGMNTSLTVIKSIVKASL